MGYEFVGLEWTGFQNHRVLRVYIDMVGGITVEDCEQVSNQLDAVLTVENGISSFSALEVSSPGINRPLFTKEQYERFVGTKAKIELYQTLSGKRNFVGIIKQALGDQVQVLTEEGLFLLPFAGIKKAHLIRIE